MASEAVLRRLDRIGQGAITAEQGLLSLNTLLRSASATVSAAKLPQLAVNAFIWDRYLQSGGKAGASTFFEEFEVQPGQSLGRRLSHTVVSKLTG
jgi:hypothetical protein